MRPVINLTDLALEHWSKGAKYESADTSFGALIGLAKLGISYSEVPPGKSSCPFHSHHVEDEVFIVLDGEGTYRFGDAVHAIGPGDVLGAPAGGPETAHQIINTGTETLKYIGLSNNAAHEICEYPDSGKFLVSSRAGSTHKLRFLGREGDGLDYWDGEEGAGG